LSVFFGPLANVGPRVAEQFPMLFELFDAGLHIGMVISISDGFGAMASQAFELLVLKCSSMQGVGSVAKAVNYKPPILSPNSCPLEALLEVVDRGPPCSGLALSFGKT
jgi:hypothetical protein